MQWNVDSDANIDLVPQIGGDEFDSLKPDDVVELLVDESLTDINVISLATDNKRDSDESDFE